MSFFHFSYPWVLALWLLLVYAAYRDLRAWREKKAALRFSSLTALEGLPRGLRARLVPFLSLLKYAAFALFVAALARPQWGTRYESVKTEGVDIVIALDASGSMAAEDFKPRNRFAVAQQVASHFIERRPSDRIALVAFAGTSVTRCPLTLDHAVLASAVEGVHLNELGDGTAVGMGLATALERLKGSKAKSKIIILVTDGRNNRGRVDPLTAAGIAEALGVKIYTVGVGSRGKVPIPYRDPVLGKRYQYVSMDLDEDTLRDVAKATGGQYFRATDSASLKSIFNVIDRLEKTEIQSKIYTAYHERFEPYLEGGLECLALWLLLTTTVLRRWP